MRERWLGATGRRVPEIAVEGEGASVEEGVVAVGGERYEALVAAELPSEAELRAAHEAGRPVVVRAADAEAVKRALARPEVSFVVVPPGRRDLVELDLRKLTYG